MATEAHYVLPWLFYTVSVIFSLVFAYILVKILSSKSEASKLVTLVNTVAFATALMTALLMPIDIFNVSSTVDPSTGLAILSEHTVKEITNTMRIVYYCLFLLCQIMVFIVIPFAFFFFEEEFEEDQTTRTRLVHAGKYTLAFAFAVCMLMLVGLVLRPDVGDLKKNELAQWFAQVFDSSSSGRRAISFVVACMMVVGVFTWCFYSAYGFGALPASMVRPRASAVERQLGIAARLDLAREKRRVIEAKYRVQRRKKLNYRDRREIKKLDIEEAQLTRGASSLVKREHSALERAAKALAPFRVAGGAVITVLSVISLFSLGMRTLDQELHKSSGFTLVEPHWRGPLDILFTLLSHWFPFDLVVFSVVVAYMVVATVFGLIALGVRVLFIKLFDIRSRHTSPQAMLLVSAMVIFSILTMTQSLQTIAPQYTTFGSQTYNTSFSPVEPIPLANESQVLPCTSYANVSTCTMTVISRMLSEITFSMPIFAFIFHYSHYAFLLVALFGAAVTALARADNGMIPLNSEDDEDGFDDDDVL